MDALEAWPLDREQRSFIDAAAGSLDSGKSDKLAALLEQAANTVIRCMASVREAEEKEMLERKQADNHLAVTTGLDEVREPTFESSSRPTGNYAIWPSPLAQADALAHAAAYQQIERRLDEVTQLMLLRGGGAPAGASPAVSDVSNLVRQLVPFGDKAASLPQATASASPASLDQLKQVVDLLSVLLNKDGAPVLGQVNGALGQTIGKLLDGKKSALGIGGALVTALLSAVTASPNAGGLAGLLGTIATSVPGMSQVAMPILLGLAAWGVLGKLEKWAQGTAPPPTGAA